MMNDSTEKQNSSDDLANPSEEVRSEQASQPQAAANASAASGVTPDIADDLMQEIREFGSQLEAAFRAALESERTKQLQRDLMGGLKELSAQVKTAVKSVQENPRVQQASERGKEALRNAQSSKTTQDLQETIVAGVAQLNVQLRKLVERLETPDAETPVSTIPTQHVPVETDATSATGPTTRLDPDLTENIPGEADPRD